MIYTAASHQGVTEMVWLHFWGAVLRSIFMYSLWPNLHVLGLRGETGEKPHRYWENMETPQTYPQYLETYSVLSAVHFNLM